MVDDLHLLRHRRDDGELGIRVELGARCPREPGLVARVLDDHALQAEAQAEDGDAVLARERQRTELAFDPAHTEPARDADAVDIGELFRGALGCFALV